MLTLLRFGSGSGNRNGARSFIMRIDGKVAVITGASEGIGAACAVRFRERGARLVLTARSCEKLERVAAPDEVIVAGDITSAETRRAVVETALARFGRIDILVNNAGVGLYGPSWQQEPAQVRALFEVNFFAPFEMARLVIPAMRARRSGMIVNVGSIAGKTTLPWMNLYSATKSALGTFTEGLRMELMRDGIRTMLVCPGYVKTGFQQHTLRGSAPRAVASRRYMAITPEACASAIARGVEREARTVLAPPGGWLLVAAMRLFPSVVERRMAALLDPETPA